LQIDRESILYRESIQGWKFLPTEQAFCGRSGMNERFGLPIANKRKRG
jgi:hypothetical protein